MTGVDTTAANLAADTTANHVADTTANHVADTTDAAFPAAGGDRHHKATGQIPTSNGTTPVAAATARIVITGQSLEDRNHEATGRNRTSDETTLVMTVTARTQM